MQTIFSGLAFFEFYQDIFGWAAFLLAAAVLVVFALRLKRYQPDPTRTFWIILGICLLMVPAAGSVGGFRIAAGSALPPPGIPLDPKQPLLLVFAFVPAFLAGGILGPGPGLLVGALTGAWTGFFQTHNLFTTIEFGAVSLLFSWAVNQRYRTIFYRLLRLPIFSAVVLAVLYPALNTFSNSLLYAQPLVLRIDYALSHVWTDSIAIGGSILIAGAVAQIVARVIPQFWMIHRRLEPSPAELRIETRFAYRFGPLAVFLILVLFWGDWIVAGEAAERLLHDRMRSIGSTASESIPPFLETGQTVLMDIAGDPALGSNDPAALEQYLSDEIRQIPYFYQLKIIAPNGDLVTSYPQADILNLSDDIRSGLDLLFTAAIPFQMYTDDAVPGASAARMVMMTPITDSTGLIKYALVGECGLDANPYSASILTDLKDIEEIGGSGILVDSRGRIIFHPISNRLFQPYSGQVKLIEDTFSELSPLGTRTLVYSRPVEGMPWTVVVSIPAEQATQLALDIAVPLFLILLGTILVLIFFVRFAMRNITSPIQQLAEEARQISSGIFSREIDMDRVDEVGTLGTAFDQMRVSLSAHLKEIQQILTISQGVASSLNMSEASQPILKAALGFGASSARIVLSRNALPEYHQGMPTRFGYGPKHEEYRAYDEKIWEVSQKQDKVILENPRKSGFGRGTDAEIPSALIAVALHYEDINYGVLWIAYDRPHTFTDEETRYMTAIGGQAALAAANTSLYQRFQLGHQRLQTVIESTPDAVLVTDREGRLVLSNPASEQILNNDKAFKEGELLEDQLSNRDLIGMLKGDQPGPYYLEIEIRDGEVYQAVTVETRTPEGYMGKVCLLRDISHFKEVEDLKSEFVSTVSHNLLQPLSTMQGYTSMVSAVGETNPQQEKFLADINRNIDDMNRTVQNLLNLRRVEGGLRLEKEKFDFKELLDAVIGKQKVFASQKRIEINRLSDKAVPLHADKKMIENTLINLLDNAIRFNRPNGSITIDYKAKGNLLEFSIEDTGIGISEIDREKVFEEFYQVVRKESGGGPGLGLTIAKNAVERHSGRIWVESTLGRRSTFFFRVPLGE